MSLILKYDYTSSAASLTGFATNVTGAAFTLTATTVGDSLAHLVTVQNNTANDHSAITITIIGTNADGAYQTETITGPGISATVTSTKWFKTLVSVTPSATIGADTFNIGWAASSISPWQSPQLHPEYFVLGIGCGISSGTPTYTVQHTYADSTVAVFNHSSIAAKTVNAEGSYTVPVASIRLAFTAAGGVSMRVIQPGV